MKRVFPRLTTRILYQLCFGLFFVLVTAGQLQRLPLTPSVAILGHEILLVCWLTLFAPRLHRYSRSIMANTWKKYPLLLALAAYVVLHAVFSQLLTVDLIALLYLIRLSLYVGLVALLYLGVQEHYISRGELLLAPLLTGLGIAMLGQLQYAFLPDTRFLKAFGWDDHYYRLISTLFDPNFTAMIIGLSVLLLLHFAKTLHRQQLIGAGATLMSALLLTYSRAGFLSAAVGILTWVILTKQWRYLALLCVFFLIPLLPRPAGEGVKLERTASVVSRFERNTTVLSQLHGVEWIIGQGLYRQRPISDTPDLPNHAKTADNSFIVVFVAFGAVGSILFFFAWVEILRQLSNPLFVSTVATIFTHSMVNNTLFYPWTLVFLGCIAIWSLDSRAK